MSEVPYSNYPRGPVSNPQIDFSAFSRAIKLGSENIGPFLLAGLCFSVPIGAVVGFFQIIQPHPAPGDTAAAMAALPMSLGLSFVGNIVQGILLGIMATCMMTFTLAAVRNGRADINDFFKGFSKVGVSLVTGLLVQIGSVIGFLLCCIPGLIVTSVTMFSYAEVADSTLGPVEAIMASTEKTKGQILVAFAFYLVMGLLSLVGLVGLGVGVLWTLPVSYAALAFAYCDITGTGASAPMQGQPSPYGAPGFTPYNPSAPSTPPAPEAPQAPDQP